MYALCCFTKKGIIESHMFACAQIFACSNCFWRELGNGAEERAGRGQEWESEAKEGNEEGTCQISCLMAKWEKELWV